MITTEERTRAVVDAVYAAARELDYRLEELTPHEAYRWEVAAAGVGRVVPLDEGLAAVAAYYRRVRPDPITPEAWLARIRLARSHGAATRGRERLEAHEVAALARLAREARAQLCRTCGALPGERCVNLSTRLPMRHAWHPQRGAA